MMDDGSTRETFEVNGQTYASLDDVPQPYRDSIAALMADADGDGVPDAFQTGASTHHVVHTVSEFQVDDSVARPDPRPIVTRAGWSGRTRLLLAFVAVDAAIAIAVVWMLTR